MKDYKLLLLDHFINSMPIEVDRHYADNLLEKVIDSEVQRRVLEARIEIWSEVDRLSQGYRSFRMSDIAHERLAKLNKPEIREE